MKPRIAEFTKIDGNTSWYSVHGLKAKAARIWVEQDANLVLKKLKLKLLGQPNDEVLLKTDKRFKHYKAHEDRIILKDSLIFQKHYGETDNVNFYQILILKQLDNEVSRRLHGEFGKNPGKTKAIIAYKENFFLSKHGTVNQAVVYVT